MLHLPQSVCEVMLGGLSADEFCETDGKDTLIEGQYTYEFTHGNGCLVLILKTEIADWWKNHFFNLQVLQAVLSDHVDIGVTVDYSNDFLGFKESADSCGYEISEDCTKIVESSDDNDWFFPIIMPACIKMQVFEEKSCKDIKVEFIKLDVNGEMIDRVLFPEITESSDNTDTSNTTMN